MEVDFFILDLRFHGTSKELYDETFKNIKIAFKEFSCLKACMIGKESYVVTIIAIAKTTEVILPPQRFNLVSFQRAIDELKYWYDPDISKEDAVSTGIVTLEQVDKLTKQIKKKYIEVSKVRASYVTSTWLPYSEKTKPVVEALCLEGISLDFHHLMLEEQLDEVNDDFGNLLLLLREWPNCSIQRIMNSKFSLQSLTKGFVGPPSGVRDTETMLAFSSEHKIRCQISKPFFDLSAIPTVEICACHNKRLPPANTAVVCGTTGRALSSDQLSSAYQIGTLTICCSEKSHTKELQVIKRLKVDGLCYSLLYGESYYIIPVTPHKEEFSALCKILIEKKEALLASSHYDLETGERTFLKQHFGIFPGEHGYMLAKKIMGEEQVKPMKPIESTTPTEEVISEMQDILEKVPSVLYNPLDFSGELFTQVARAVSSQNSSNQLENKKPTKKKLATEEVKKQSPTKDNGTAKPNGNPGKTPTKPKKLLHPRRIIDD